LSSRSEAEGSAVAFAAAAAVSVAVAVAVALPSFVFAVILSEAKDPETLDQPVQLDPFQPKKPKFFAVACRGSIATVIAHRIQLTPRPTPVNTPTTNSTLSQINKHHKMSTLQSKINLRKHGAAVLPHPLK
jgi:hypothetical protein